MQRQAAGGPKGSRRQLKGAVLHLARVPPPLTSYGTDAYILCLKTHSYTVRTPVFTCVLNRGRRS